MWKSDAPDAMDSFTKLDTDGHGTRLNDLILPPLPARSCLEAVLTELVVDPPPPHRWLLPSTGPGRPLAIQHMASAVRAQGRAGHLLEVCEDRSYREQETDGGEAHRQSRRTSASTVPADR
ncbi:hypothetical protein [Streptomyces sp. NPDC056165]|uniref:hypothetical protein n=1 Tax=Streptomyces sp. NPDC056165 TaxID=3345733 RepID=UPI0035D82064